MDFRDRDHAIKLTLSCETDKLKPLSKKFEMLSKKLPVPVGMFDDPETVAVDDIERWDWEQMLPIAMITMIIIIGFVALLVLSGRSRTSAPTA